MSFSDHSHKFKAENELPRQKGNHMGLFDFFRKRNNEPEPVVEQKNKAEQKPGREPMRLPEPERPQEKIRQIRWSVKKLIEMTRYGRINSDAMKDLGDCYYAGIGTEISNIRCCYWRKRALALDTGWKEGPAKVRNIEKLVNPYEKAVVDMLLGASEITHFIVGFDSLDGLHVSYWSDIGNLDDLPLDSINKLKGISASWWHRKLQISGPSVPVRMLEQALARFAFDEEDMPDYLKEPVIIHFDNGDCYEGCLKNDLFDEEGRYTWSDGSYYEGDWANGKKNGEGLYCLADGSDYQGTFKNDFLDGHVDYFGIHCDSYDGQYKNGKMHGYGTFKWSDGRKYEGDWVNGLQEGTGTFTDSDGTQYTGEWLAGKKHGRGVMKYSDGRALKGSWENDEFITPVLQKEKIDVVSMSVSELLEKADNGTGNIEAMKALGDRYYEGNGTEKNAIRSCCWRKKALDMDPGWAEGPAKVSESEALLNRYEKAVLPVLLAADDLTVFKKTNDLSRGFRLCSSETGIPLDSIKQLEGIENASWKQGALDIQGMPAVRKMLAQAAARFFFDEAQMPEDLKNLVVIHYENGDCYEGEMKNGVFEGTGRYTQADGVYYDGSWTGGRKEGHGIYHLADGSVYDADFKEGRLNGKGTYKGANGDTYSGEFKDGRKHGEGEYHWADGSFYKGKWRYDRQQLGGTMHYANGEVFGGFWDNGKYGFSGKYYYADGSVYDGGWKNNLPDGWGKITSADGTQYYGEWSEGKKNGHGFLTYPDGRSVEGRWENDELKEVNNEEWDLSEKTISELLKLADNGKGVVEAMKALGDRYYDGNGTEKNAVRSCYWRKRALALEPDWEEGPAKVSESVALLNKYEKAVISVLLAADDLAVFNISDYGESGISFWSEDENIPLDSIKKLEKITDAEWVVGEMHVSGPVPVRNMLEKALARFFIDEDQMPDYLKHCEVIHYDNGDCYEGDLKNGLFDWLGLYTWADGSYYDGDWVNGKKDGSGDYHMTDGSLLSCDFKDDLAEGCGRFYGSNGDTYSGDFSKGKMSGDGHYTWADGRDYNGDWADGLPEGDGTYTDKDGSKHKGQWHAGKMDGLRIISQPGKMTLEVIRENDEPGGLKKEEKKKVINPAIPDLPRMTVAVVGEKGSGKTTLTAAITKVLSARYGTGYEPVSVQELDNRPEERKFGGTIDTSVIEYRTSSRHYTHIDCPGASKYFKNALCGMQMADVCILVVSAEDGIYRYSTDLMRLLRLNTIVFLNKCDTADPEAADLVQDELIDRGFYGQIIMGSAAEALADPYGSAAQSILDLMKKIDEIPVPKRDTGGALSLPVHKVYVSGEDRIVTGRISRGTVHAGDSLELTGCDGRYCVKAEEIRYFDRNAGSACAGDYAGIRLSGEFPDEMKRGMLLTAPGSKSYYNTFTAEVRLYQLYKHLENDDAYVINFRPDLQCWFGLTMVTGTISEMSFDDNTTITVYLRDNVPLDIGDSLILTMNNRPVGTGYVEDAELFGWQEPAERPDPAEQDTGNPGKDIYEGELRNGLPHGHGKLTASDGTVTEGVWDNGALVKGRRKFPDGETYEGEFLRNKRHGYGIADLAVTVFTEEDIERLKKLDQSLGQVINEDKYRNMLTPETQRQIMEIRKREKYFDRYEGEWKNNACNGYGTAYYLNGEVYEGDWAHGVPYGHGRLRRKSGKVIETDWDPGIMKFHSEGKIRYPDGSVYKGSLSMDRPDGEGTLTCTDGRYYTGIFICDGLPTGEFTLHYPNGDTYTGMMVNGVPAGDKGIMKYADGDAAEKRNGSDRQDENHTVIKYPNGDVYEGETGSDGKPDGTGIMKYADGRIYEGDFRNGRRDGMGVMTYPDGHTATGIWENDILAYDFE